MNAGLTYRETSVQGASPVRMVVLLYEQAIADVRRALAAQQRGDIEGRTREINHVLLVIGYLQATLDKDQGGPVALNLERFYEHLRAGLIEAQFEQSAGLLEQQISHLVQVCEAWREVEQTSTRPASPAYTAQPAPLEQTATSEWKA